ncbi:MAG: GTP-binding protein [Thermoproteota archaeon]|nr:MAG: GTP-binding protein [Candidatus Korarchaeota archaeon]
MRTARYSEISRKMRGADLVIHVIDARAPHLTRSPRLESMAEDRGIPLILALNKVDLVPEDVVRGWLLRLRSEGTPVAPISATGRLGTLRLRRLILRTAGRRPCRVLVVGYPKVGKSSLVNVLKGRHSASTSPVPGSPGYTRHFQLYRGRSGIYLVDSPGILPPEGGPLEMVVRGASPESLRNPVTPALELLRLAYRVEPELTEEYVGEPGEPSTDSLASLALRRGAIFRSTGEPNLAEAARMVIRDYHRGRLRAYFRPEWLSP